MTADTRDQVANDLMRFPIPRLLLPALVASIIPSGPSTLPVLGQAKKPAASKPRAATAKATAKPAPKPFVRIPPRPAGPMLPYTEKIATSLAKIDMVPIRAGTLTTTDARTGKPVTAP